MASEFDFYSVGGVAVSMGGNGPLAWDFGWRVMPLAVDKVVATSQYRSLAQTPTGGISLADVPKRQFLWKATEKVTGKPAPIRNQGRVGSCVSFGTATAIERVMCAEIVAGELEEYRDLVQEVIYGGSRVEVGGGQITGDGSVGAWAAEFVRKWGVVARGQYGSFDLREYSETTCRQFGSQGVPTALEAEAKLHPISDATLVTNTDDAVKALAAGHAIAACSDQGFSMQRDERGVAAPSGSWAHCMCIDAYVLDDGEWFHVENSWGPNAHTGPVGWGEPTTGGFWAAKAVIDRMLRQRDSWALAGLAGWRSTVLPLWLI